MTSIEAQRYFSITHEGGLATIVCLLCPGGALFEFVVEDSASGQRIARERLTHHLRLHECRSC
jgi:hypothetical protein